MKTFYDNYIQRQGYKKKKLVITVNAIESEYYFNV